MARVRAATRCITRAANIGQLPGFYPFEPFEAVKQIDVLAAMYGRVLSWELSFEFTHSAIFRYDDPGSSDYTEDFISGSGTYTRDFDSYSSKPGGDSEKEFANNIQSLAMDQTTGLITGAGTSTGYQDINGSLTPAYLFGYPLSIRIGFDACLGGFPPTTGPFAIDPLYYLPFNFETGATNLGPNNYFTLDCEIARTAPTGYTQVGTFNIAVPDWLEAYYPGVYPGASQLSTILIKQDATLPADVTASRSISITGTLTPKTCYPYGLDPNNPLDQTTMNRIWNNDGTAAQNPLNPTAP